MSPNEFILPNWPAPNKIKAFSTTRLGGISLPPYDQLNLGLGTGDDPIHVQQNRKILAEKLHLPESPLWMIQTHSNIAVDTSPSSASPITADARYSNQLKQVCVVQTADCLPLLVCNQQGSEVAAIHAGWRGLATGIIENTLQFFTTSTKDLLVWLGPAIGPSKFEVGKEVKAAFCNNNSENLQAFSPLGNDKYLASIYQLATIQLHKLGITQIYGGNFCTFSEEGYFFSYRRNKVTGRMASLIWINA
ncbi:MAG: multi-copper polyphenol oxidoreductase [Gammaproteobacteria bacterium RIFCSPHIGHO2_12_FULL_35_23]|nr:MAG: multi-copper polyphenol oxidoreductase [Gammaproteobacteria bacterium RIFCSPHIGHO2_12_FULL_35_23]